MKAFLAFVLVLVSATAVQAAEPDQPPVEVFFKNPQFSGFELSPDGKSIAMLAPFEGFMNLYVYDLETREPKVLTGESIDVTWFTWVNNDRLMYSMNQYTFGSYENRYSGGLVAIDKDGGNHDVLTTRFDRKKKGGWYVLNYLDRYEQDDELVLVTNNQRRKERPDVFLLNVYNGGLKRVFNNPARINGYALDECGKPRFGTSFSDDDATVTLWYRKAGSDEWETIQKDSEDFDSVIPVGISCDSDKGFVSSNADRDRRAIFRYDFLTATRSEKPILQSDVYDINANAITAFGGKGLVGFRYQADKPKQVYFEKTHKAMQEMIDKTLPDRINTVVSVDDTGSKLIIVSITDNRAPAYYLLHVDGMKMEPLAATRPWLDEYELSETQPISYTARDGMTIHGYLTLPKSYTPGKPVPLIVNPHGGPWARDTWGLGSWISFEPQFYASRGFAVLQPNFRGSTGYGKAHLEASFKKLEAMHHDVIDGVLWAIEQGYADPDKIGSAGASWGGYATMTALTHNPELFRFGINLFGVVDLVEHIKTYKQWDRDSGYEYWLKRIGDPSIETDLENLIEWSPMTYVDKIEAPVFIYHGLRDFNVDIEQSRMLASALGAEGKDYTFVFRSDEAHSAFDEENRIDLYKQIDAFLSEVTANW
jgi:dipeptidyl aminopeptidase/acylaminoacyl peptidase